MLHKGLGLCQPLEEEENCKWLPLWNWEVKLYVWKDLDHIKGALHSILGLRLSLLIKRSAAQPVKTVVQCLLVLVLVCSSLASSHGTLETLFREKSFPLCWPSVWRFLVVGGMPKQFVFRISLTASCFIGWNMLTRNARGKKCVLMTTAAITRSITQAHFSCCLACKGVFWNNWMLRSSNFCGTCPHTSYVHPHRTPKQKEHIISVVAAQDDASSLGGAEHNTSHSL